MASLGPLPKLKLFWKGTLMRFAMGFWVSLASSSALLDSGSVAGSAAFPLNSAKLKKIATTVQIIETDEAICFAAPLTISRCVVFISIALSWLMAARGKGG